MAVSEEKILTLEEKMDQMEQNIETANTLLQDLNKKMDRIEMGLFGDPAIGFAGVMETQKQLSEKIKFLEREIEDIKKVNDQQEVSIHAKKDFTDDLEKYTKWAFWAAGFVILLLLAGKLGLVDAIKLLIR